MCFIVAPMLLIHKVQNTAVLTPRVARTARDNNAVTVTTPIIVKTYSSLRLQSLSELRIESFNLLFTPQQSLMNEWKIRFLRLAKITSRMTFRFQLDKLDETSSSLLKCRAPQ